MGLTMVSPLSASLVARLHDKDYNALATVALHTGARKDSRGKSFTKIRTLLPDNLG